MSMSTGSPTDSHARRRRSRVYIAIVAILCTAGVALFAASCASSRTGPPTPPASAAGTIDTGTLTAGNDVEAPIIVKATADGNEAAFRRRPITGPVLRASSPVSLSIPALKVTTSLVRLGLNRDGSVQVPNLNEPHSKAGWYKNSPAPGSLGPSIILGHIDSRKYGPGVFYRLGKLRPGNIINVTRKDHTVAVFRVDGVRVYAKNHFPTLEVYGNINHAGLRLITCGGKFDPSIRSYESNIVAYATLISSHRAK